MTAGDWDCIVVGAGVVGSAVAYKMACDGRKVLLLERDWNEPDRIVGELLQPGGMDALKKLGLEGCTEGIDAITNIGYGVFYDKLAIPMTYPLDPASGKPLTGRSFHHGRFVMKLREKCLSHASITTKEATVNELVTEEINGTSLVTGVRCTMKDEITQEKKTVEFYAPLTIGVDGCFSKFRKEIAHRDVMIKSHFVGAILEDCSLPLPNHGHVILAQPSPVLLYQIGTHDTRVLVDVPGKVPSAGTGALKEHMLKYVMPQLPTAVQPSFAKAIKDQRLRVMPNSFLPAVRNDRPGFILVGDALNMRHPLTGGGMTVGFLDIVLLTKLLHPSSIPSFHDTDGVLAAMDRFHRTRKNHCTVINVLAQALYALFSAGDSKELGILREACFAYFHLGGICVEHPIGLLSGLIQNQFVLYFHFFAVAVYGMVRLMCTPLPFFSGLMIPKSTIKATEMEDSFLAMVYRGLNLLLLILFATISSPVNLCVAIKTLVIASVVLAQSF